MYGVTRKERGVFCSEGFSLTLGRRKKDLCVLKRGGEFPTWPKKVKGGFGQERREVAREGGGGSLSWTGGRRMEGS